MAVELWDVTEAVGLPFSNSVLFIAKQISGQNIRFENTSFIRVNMPLNK